MAILRCKMCGGDITIIDSQNIGVCEYCGCSITIPKYDTEYTLAQFNNANDYRIAGEFEKAENICAEIIVNDPTNAEAYWCALLSKYGIEYVEDVVTMDRIPTCHRILKESILEDVNYKKAIEFSDGISKRIYEKEARKINELLKNVIAISEREEPYDIFISYKENDEFGARTLDSVLAHDLYNSLTKEGYRVFFSKISLEDKLGEEYEPYIYAALNSAKVMFLIGTCRENIESTWVKNEWSRFQKLTKNDTTKKLIPCYKDMQVNELPEEMSILQAQDLNRLGAIQDILHGLKKVFNKEIMPISSASTEKVDERIVRAFQLLEDGEFYKAKDLLNVILEDDVNCAKAYIGLLLCNRELRKETDLITIRYSREMLRDRSLIQPLFWGLDKMYLRGREVAEPEYRDILEEYENQARETFMEDTQLASDYEYQVKYFQKPDEYNTYKSLLLEFKYILSVVGNWKEADKYVQACEQKIQEEEEQYNRQKGIILKANEDAERRIIIKNGVVVGIQMNGNVLVSGNDSLQQIVSSWKNIKKIDLSDDGKLLVAITSDDQIICTSNLVMREMKGYSYLDVKAGKNCVIGLKNDGTVLGILEGKLYNPNWRNVKNISCSETLILALSVEGEMYSNNAELFKDKYDYLARYAYVASANGRAYGITDDGDARNISTRKYYEFFTNVVKIKIINDEMYGLNTEGEFISWREIGRTYKGERKHTWSKELVDFVANDKVIYGVKYDGTLWKAEKYVDSYANSVYGLKEKEIVSEKLTVALFMYGREMIRIFADGSVYSSNEERDLSSWKLFNDVTGIQVKKENTNLLEYQKIESNIENHVGKTSKEMADDLISGIVFLLDENIKKASEIAQKESEKRQAYKVELQNMYVIYRQIMEQTENLDDKYKIIVEEKTEQLKSVLDIGMKMEDKEEANKTCRNCGNEVRAGKKFCSRCGTRVEE